MRKVSITGIILFAVLILLSISSAASVTRIYTTASSDGVIAAEAGDQSAIIDSPILSTQYPGTSSYQSFIIIEFPIASLQGKTLEAGSTTLNLYSLGIQNAILSRLEFDGDGIIDWDDWYGHQLITVNPLNCPAETWYSMDVTSHLQAQIDAGYNWAGFVIHAKYGDPASSIAAYEDAQGRGAYLEIVAAEPSGYLVLLVGVTGICSALVRRRRV